MKSVPREKIASKTERPAIPTFVLRGIFLEGITA